MFSTIQRSLIVGRKAVNCVFGQNINNCKWKCTGASVSTQIHVHVGSGRGPHFSTVIKRHDNDEAFGPTVVKQNNRNYMSNVLNGSKLLGLDTKVNFSIKFRTVRSNVGRTSNFCNESCPSMPKSQCGAKQTFKSFYGSKRAGQCLVANASSYTNVSSNRVKDRVPLLCLYNQQWCDFSTSMCNRKLKNKEDPEIRGFTKDSTATSQLKKDEHEADVKLETKKKVWEENIWTLPNFLTVSRICLTPYLGYLVVQGNFTWAAWLFVLAGFTDVLDGHIARNWPQQKSAFGSALDPLADKILISTLFITLSVVDLIPVMLTTLIIARDVALIGAAFYVRYISLPPPLTLSRFFDGTNVTMKLKPTFVSKINTAIQLSLVCCTLVAPVFHFVDHPFLHGLWYLTAATTLYSGLGYVFRKDTYEIYKTTKEAKTKYK